MPKGWRFLLVAAVSSVAYLGLIASGLSRGAEYYLYDRYLQLCPRKSSSPDEKIIVVGLTEEDIVKIGGFPVNDRLLGDLLLKIRKQNPRVIGLDLHRNAKTGNSDSASQKLASIFRETPNLIGVEKTTGGNPLEKPILPHPELVGRTGASEVIEDDDGIVRRGYLYLQKSVGEELSQQNLGGLATKTQANDRATVSMLPSFSLAVALKYLEKENIKPTGYKSWLKLNQTVFTGLRVNRRFYSADSIDNYQILINYCSAQKSFKQLSFSQVLSEDFEEEVFRERIVLIGSTSETVDDIFKIPNQRKIVRGDWELIFGVEVHGYLASAIINSALKPNQANSLSFLPISVEYSLLSLLLLSESLLLVVWLHKKSRTFMGLTGFLLMQVSLIFMVGWLVFLAGWWIPVASYVYIILFIALTGSFFVYIDKLKNDNILLEEKVRQKTQKLEEAYKQIAAQEKLFAYQGLAKTLSHEIKNQTNALKANAQNCSHNISQIKQIIEENYYLFGDAEDFDEGFVDPRQLCSQSLEQLSRIDYLVEKITLILQELNRNSGREGLKVSSLDLNELLKVIVTESTQVKQIENLEINGNYDDSLSLVVGVKQHLERALENIVLNACNSLALKSKELKDYVPTLELVTKERADSIEIRIKDNGQGIALEEQDKIFAMHWTTRSETGGKGLGLYFAKNLIREHGGDINVESQPGEYAEFIIRLPKS